MTAHSSKIPPLPKCQKGHDIPGNVTLCIVCGVGVGYPNVRYAERREETEALNKRLSDARISARAKGTLEELEAFGRAVSDSEAVVSRSSGDLDLMLRGEGNLMQAYHPAVRARLRIPSNNEYDPNRDMIDSRISPLFYDKLHFAALSLDRRGVPYYGDFAITLRSDMINNRATVFEQNPAHIADNHPLASARGLPYGYRATWNNRGKLAMAKLEPKIDENSTTKDFPEILMEQFASPEATTFTHSDQKDQSLSEIDKEDKSSATTDFVEVHVYGDIHPRAFKHVIANILNDDLEKLIWQRMQMQLDKFGVTYQDNLSVEDAAA